jgi:hypothetical protein
LKRECPDEQHNYPTPSSDNALSRGLSDGVVDFSGVIRLQAVDFSGGLGRRLVDFYGVIRRRRPNRRPDLCVLVSTK